jgi:hypothetical protein
MSVLLAALLGMSAVGPAVADRPRELFALHEEFPSEEPCTGLQMQVALDTTFYEHAHADRFVVHGKRTISTTLGYAGTGRSNYVNNGPMEKFSFHDMVTDDSGHRFQVHGVFVFDRKTETVRVEEQRLHCAGS